MKKRLLIFLIKFLLNYKKYKAKALYAAGKIRISRYPLWVLYQPYPFKVSGRDMQEILDKLQPGDIILRGYKWKKL